MQVLEQLRALGDERFLALYESLSQQGFGPLDAEVAAALKFRPQAIRKLPMPQRAKKARSILLAKNQTELAYELFGTYLLKTHKGLVTGFLDKTGVKHEDGMIEDLDGNPPDAAKLPGAVAELDREFPPADVTLYLAMCAQQWPAVKRLDELWRERSGAAATK
ncbi:MAG: hypothetical protein IPK67_01660 [Planctomycetes bacterium]|jgi:hypothetical protein|nr:hypothetical protein [Planctomycetota bacterium]